MSTRPTAEQAGSAGDSDRTAGVAQGLVLIFCSALPTMAIVSLVPNLPQLLTRFAATPHAELLVPMIITLPSLCIALFSPIAGAIADFWGRRPLLLIAMALYSAVGVLPVLLDNLSAILVTRFAIGIAEAAILTCQNALMGDYFAGASRQTWLGRQSFIGPFVAALLVLAGGYLGSLSWRAPFLLYLLGLPMLLWAAIAVWEPAPQTKELQATSANSKFPWNATRQVVAVTIGVSLLYFVQAIQLGRMFAEHGIASPARIGLFVTIASAGVALGGWAYARLSRLTVGHRFTVILLAYAIGYAGIGLAPSALATVPLALIAQFGNGLAIPTLIGWALGKYDFAHRGRGMGIWGGSFFVGTFLSPPAVTLLGRLIGGTFLGTVAIIGAGCLLLSIVVMAASRRAGLAAVQAEPGA